MASDEATVAPCRRPQFSRQFLSRRRIHADSDSHTSGTRIHATAAEDAPQWLRHRQCLPAPTLERMPGFFRSKAHAAECGTISPLSLKTAGCRLPAAREQLGNGLTLHRTATSRNKL